MEKERQPDAPVVNGVPMEPTPTPAPLQAGEQPQPQPTSQTDEEAQAALHQVSGLFYSGNPKHAFSGAAEGLGNVATGVTMGVAGLLGATVVGAKEEGLWGGVKGFGAGLVGVVGLSSYGLYTGARQACRGAYNTPEAVSQASRGEQYWDSSKEQWVRVCLEDDLRNLPTTDDDVRAKARKLFHKETEKEKGAAPPQTDSTAKPMDAAPGSPSASAATSGGETAAAGPYPGMDEAGEVMDYYVFLGVSRTATAAEIKKGFTRRALEMHPDKNPNDPLATARFQQLLKVHNVLSSEVTRAEYDRTGCVDGSNVQESEVNPIDEVLGVGFLEPLVGKLRFALYFEASSLYDSEMLQELHRRRRLRIAQNLCHYLDNTETGLDSAAFVLRDAVATRAGPQLLTCIAETYHTAARQQLCGGAWQRELDSWYSSKVTSISTSVGLAASGVQTAYRAARGSATEEDLLRVLVAANEADVRRTVLQACRLVLYDSSVSAEVRQQRAKRLEKLANAAVEEIRKELVSRAAASAPVPVTQSAAESEPPASPQQ